MDTPAVAGTSDDRAPRAPHGQINDIERLKMEPLTYGNMTPSDSKTGHNRQEGTATPPDPRPHTKPGDLPCDERIPSEGGVRLRGAGRLGLLMG